MQDKPFLLRGMQWDHLNDVSEVSRKEEKLVVGIKLDLQTIYI